MTGTLDAFTGRLLFADCIKSESAYSDDGDVSVHVKYRNGIGYLFLEGGALYWVDDEENTGKNLRFERTNPVSPNEEPKDNFPTGHKDFMQVAFWYYGANVSKGRIGLAEPYMNIMESHVTYAYTDPNRYIAYYCDSDVIALEWLTVDQTGKLPLKITPLKIGKAEIQIYDEEEPQNILTICVTVDENTDNDYTIADTSAEMTERIRLFRETCERIGYQGAELRFR